MLVVFEKINLLWPVIIFYSSDAAIFGDNDVLSNAIEFQGGSLSSNVTVF